jgi:hypothetical protein
MPLRRRKRRPKWMHSDLIFLYNKLCIYSMSDSNTAICCYTKQRCAVIQFTHNILSSNWFRSGDLMRTNEIRWLLLLSGDEADWGIWLRSLISFSDYKDVTQTCRGWWYGPTVDSACSYHMTSIPDICYWWSRSTSRFHKHESGLQNCCSWWFRTSVLCLCTFGSKLDVRRYTCRRQVSHSPLPTHRQ